MYTLRNRFFSLLIGQIQPNKILGLWSSIIVKMMDEHCGDLPSNFPQFYFPPPTRTPLLLYSIPSRSGASAFFLFFFLFRTDVLFAVPDSLCPTKYPGRFRLSRHPRFVNAVIFFSSMKSGDGRCLQYKTHE